ncbi:MAG: hypothetical protein AB7T49_20825 [Oligoflexales bacterium]
MPLVSGSIPNLINGVSQQPAPIRLPSQCEEQINGYSSVVEGLKKRPPLEFVAKLNSLQVGNAFIHTINRDSTERYVVIITDEDLKVYDLAGVQKTVTFPNGTAYLDAAVPSTSFRTVTIADYTFVVNLTKTVTFTSNKSPIYGSAGLVFVKQANANSNYKVFVDGVQKASHATTTSNIQTEFIAIQLATQLTTNLGAGWTVTRVQSTVQIKKNDGTAFVLDTEDSNAGNALKSAKEKIQRFTDLPTVAPRDFIIEITGDQSSTFDNYYVIFEPSDAGSNFGTGVWIETVKPDINWELDPALMPHTLIRQSDGTFIFQQATWGKRIVGDEESAPNPSFVGSMINDIFLFKNRLGFLSDESVIFSRAGEFFEFFPETVTTLLDSDPVDVAASSSKVSILRHAIPFDEDLLLFSDQTQFILKGGDILSSRTVSITQKTVFENSRIAKPVGAGKNVFFAVNNGSFTQIREYFVSDQNETNDAADITAHIPKYISKDVSKLAVTTNEDLLCTISPNTPNEVYSYKYYWRGNEKLQSAWSRWTFGNCTILNIDFIESLLYIVTQRTDGVYLEKMSVAPKQVDTNSTYLTHLDRRLQNNTSGVSASYNAGLDRTTWTLPYAVSGVMQVVTRDSTVGLKEGMLIPVIEQTGNTVKVQGKYDLEDVFIGQQYELRYTFSHQFLRESSQNGSQSALVSGRLQMRAWTLVFEDSGFFSVSVTPKFRDTFLYKFTGTILGAGNNTIGSVPLADGKFTFLVQSKNDQVTIEVINDTFLPCHLLSVEWEALYNRRSQKV